MHHTGRTLPRKPYLKLEMLHHLWLGIQCEYEKKRERGMLS